MSDEIKLVEVKLITFYKIKWWLIYNLLMVGGITSYVLFRTHVLGHKLL